jgi:eukaryotic-like serine/threonine-protein kinase
MRPERLGRYELLRHLASGGMARVYLARATGPGGFARHVVIKTIPPERRDDAQFIAMFLDEARLIATLHHQHIAQVFEVGRDDQGTYYLAMEYVHGETVRQLLQVAANRRVKLPIELGLSIACAAAAGLHHAHERRDLDGTPLGIVHRDVSPSNLIVGFDGSIKLIDFGIAKATLRTTQTVTGFIKGKAGYMAPEQARGFAVDRRSDVFALGVLAYELTTQSRAFHADSQFETMRKATYGEIEPPSRRVAGYPPGLEDIIMTALEVDPDDRFQDAEAMRVAFEQIARELGLVLGDDPVIRALERLFPPRPEPWLFGAEPAPEDETTNVRSVSEPMIMIVPRTPTKVRLARGTATPETRAVDAIPDPIPEPPQAPDTLDVTTQPYERSATYDPAIHAAITGPVAMRSPARSPSKPHPVVEARTTSVASPLPLPPARATPTPLPQLVPAAVPEPRAPPPPRADATPAPRADATPAPRADATPLPSRIPTDCVRVPRRSHQHAFAGAALALAAITTVLVIVAIVRASRSSSPPPAISDAPAETVPAPAVPVRVPVPPPAPIAPPAAPSVAPDRNRTTVLLHVTSDPEGATVVLDGVRLGVTPFTGEVLTKAGLAWLKVRKRDHKAVKTRVSLDEDVRWEVQLRRRAH